MRRLILKMSMTLDGFVAGPNGEMDWHQRSRGEEGAMWVCETIRQAGLLVVGGRMYQEWARFWPTAPGPMAEAMNTTPVAVFTRQSSFELASGQTNWAAARVIEGNLAEQMQRLKTEGGNDILAQGGVGFGQNLVRLGLVDEYRLVIHPVALGSGLGLFSDLQQPQDLNLVDATRFKSGVVAHTYRPKGSS